MHSADALPHWQVKRNYGFNVELLGGLVACPWKCGTHFSPEDAPTHLLICPLAPDPTAQVTLCVRVCVCVCVCVCVRACVYVYLMHRV
jgi:hypothetical protein